MSSFRIRPHFKQIVDWDVDSAQEQLVGKLVGCALFFYLMAQLGQKLGARQTFELHQEFEPAIGRTIEIH